tara:strand:+ start:138 stop:650 length:513 start_codon:yes stop_codon:yes gene_type:complete
MILSDKLIGDGFNKLVPIFVVILLFGCDRSNTSKKIPAPLTINEKKLIGTYELDAEELANSAGVDVEFIKKSHLLPSLELSYEISYGKHFVQNLPDARIWGVWSFADGELRLQQERIHSFSPFSPHKMERSGKTIILMVDSNGTSLRPVAVEENNVREKVPEEGRIPYKR